MSNFLQRLAAGVVHSQRAIHPSVGTIWSAAGVAGAGTAGPFLSVPASAEAIESSSEIVVPPSPRDVNAPTQAPTEPTSPLPTQPDIAPERDAPTQALTEPTSPLPTQPDIAPERHAPIRTALPRQQRVQPAILEAPARKAVAFQPLVALSQKSPGTPAPFAPQTNEAIGQSEDILPPRLRPTPEGPASPRQSRRIEFPRLAVPAPRIPAPAATSVRPPSGQSAQRAQSPKHEPDAIEIHIGRIEVLAGQPRPIQPAAPSPARKSVDLREYLRRERRPR
jgi:hypothetical protein